MQLCRKMTLASAAVCTGRAVRTGQLRREQSNHQGAENQDPLHAVAAWSDQRTTRSCSSSKPGLACWSGSCLRCGKVRMPVLTGWRCCLSLSGALPQAWRGLLQQWNLGLLIQQLPLFLLLLCPSLEIALTCY